MAGIILITGGSRSGKSAFAQQLAESLSPTRTYIATCPVIDAEMAARIEKHRRDRADRSWQTVEEETDLAAALYGAAAPGAILVDCLTLWVNNLMYGEEKKGLLLREEEVAGASREVLAAARRRAAAGKGAVIFVANEVGMGIVPDHPGGRLFRDLAGRCNQIFAREADAVVFMVSGIPLWLKGGGLFAEQP